jgi:hypothetical protein
MPPEAGFSFSGISVTNASVVSMRAEIEAAFCSAVRVSLGRIDDASLQQVLVFAGSYVEPSFPLRFLTSWTIKAPSWPALLASCRVGKSP